MMMVEQFKGPLRNRIQGWHKKCFVDVYTITTIVQKMFARLITAGVTPLAHSIYYKLVSNGRRKQRYSA